MNTEKKKPAEIQTMEDFQRAKIEDRRALLRMPRAEAQQLASPIPENAHLKVIFSPLPEDMLEALLNGKQII